MGQCDCQARQLSESFKTHSINCSINKSEKRMEDIYRPVAKKQAVHVTVYDLQGGPLPGKLRDELDAAVLAIILKYKTLAIEIREV